MIGSQLIRKESPYSHWEYLDFKTENRLRIVPERGGLITEWRCNQKDILYFDQERFRVLGKSVRGGMPIIFPICGDLPAGILPLAKGNFHINQHGFARDMSWSIKMLKNQKGISLSLCESKQTLQSFPFSFLLEIQVTLDANSLDVNIFIHNRGEEKMPFSFGIHPYFRVSDLDKIAIRGLSETCIDHLNMSKDSTYRQLSKLSKGIDFLTTSINKGLVELIDLDNLQSLEMHTQDPMDLVVVWTDPPRKMLCLEPWTSPRQSLITRERMLLLDPGEIKKLRCKFVSNELITPNK